MDYTYGVSSTTPTISPLTYVFTIVISIITIIGTWKLYVKAGKPGWASIVPFYNFYVLFEIAGMNGWLFLLLLVPIADIIIFIMMCLNLAKAFGKEVAFAIGLILLYPIFTLILGFSKDKYVGNK